MNLTLDFTFSVSALLDGQCSRRDKDAAELEYHSRANLPTLRYQRTLFQGDRNCYFWAPTVSYSERD
jgi:hypothetical protein